MCDRLPGDDLCADTSTVTGTPDSAADSVAPAPNVVAVDSPYDMFLTACGTWKCPTCGTERI